jgi:hypothetical protein
MIVVAGDSYCGHLGEGTWPDVLSKNLGMPIKQYSNSGGSWWATRRMLLRAKQSGELDNAKIVVLCHTEGSRIPNIDDVPLGGWAVENQPAWYEPAILKAAKLYYEYLHDPDFGAWAQQAWLNECVDLFPKDAIVIHLHSFPYSYLKLKVPNGVNFFPPLFAITQAEFTSDKEGFKFIEKNGDSRKNHFNEKNNLALGHEITKIIKDGITSGEYKADLSKFYIKNIEIIKQHSTGSGDIMYNGKII